MLASFSKTEHAKFGKEIILSNPFYYTLHILLKYSFVKQDDFYIINFIKEITKSETEFKVFMVYKEYALYKYHTHLRELFTPDDNIDDIVYTIIYNMKIEYDNDRSVIKPFIITINENENEIIDKFNFIKNHYELKTSIICKFEQLNIAIEYLEKSKELEKKAKEIEEQSKKYSSLAIDILHVIKNHFENTISKKELQINF